MKLNKERKMRGVDVMRDVDVKDGVVTATGKRNSFDAQPAVACNGISVYVERSEDLSGDSTA